MLSDRVEEWHNNLLGATDFHGLWGARSQIAVPGGMRSLRYLFGGNVTRHFNQTNDLDMIARAHQLVMEGCCFRFFAIIRLNSFFRTV